MVWGSKSKGIDDVVVKLWENTTQESLILFSNRKLGEKEVEQLCDALAENTSLKELLCSGHYVSKEGAKCFADALRKNLTLEKLAFADHNFGDAALSVFLGEWNNPVLKELDLEYKGLTSAGMRCIGDVLSGLNCFHKLVLSRNAIGDIGILELAKGIGTSKYLVELNLTDTNLGEKGCGILGQALSNVQHSPRAFTLYLDNNSFGDNGLQLLVTSKPESPSNGIEIEKLSLRECKLTTSGVQILEQALKHNKTFSKLQSLDLANNYISSCKHLSSHPTLCKLNLRGNKLGVKGISSISSTLAKSRLKHLDLSTTGFDINNEELVDAKKALKELAESPTIEQLHLFGNSVGKVSFDSFAIALKTNRALKYLDLSGTGITVEIIKDLLNALETNTHLRTLELGGNNISDQTQRTIRSFQDVRRDLDIVVNKSIYE